MNDDQWIPHKPATWPWRIGCLKRAVEMRKWHGHGAEPEFTYWTSPAGTPVKIVMVSRLGDVGVTEDLQAETGYAARILLADIEPGKAERADPRAPAGAGAGARVTTTTDDGQ